MQLSLKIHHKVEKYFTFLVYRWLGIGANTIFFLFKIVFNWFFSVQNWYKNSISTGALTILKRLWVLDRDGKVFL